MSRDLRLSSGAGFFERNHDQRTEFVKADELPKEEVEMDQGAMSQYSWEFFYHIPLMIAESLSRNLHFSESQKWYHFIFDPIDTSSEPKPQRFGD